MLNKLVTRTENWFFSHRALTLGVLLVLTAVMAFFAVQLRMEAGFEKQMPVGHEYIKTFQQYKAELFGANRITVVVRARNGTIWTKEGLSRLHDVTQAVTFLPGVDRPNMQSLWTPNSFVTEITEEGLRADPVISGAITPESLTPEIIDGIRRGTNQGGFIGQLVSRDERGAMITAELNEMTPDGKTIDYVAFNRLLEKDIRSKFEDANYEIQIIGFAKQTGDIADGASGVLVFCSIALLLTGLAVYWYCHSVRLTVLVILCSLTSLIWQFGALRLIGYGLDPLAVLVPFLVFAIGVSHGVQQINFFVRGLSRGLNVMTAARASFSGLLIPGVLALVTALVSFVTLLLVPIPMIHELAITASLGVGFKIVTNLIMLPVTLSCLKFDQAFAEHADKKRAQRIRWTKTLSFFAKPKASLITIFVAALVFGVSIYESRNRIVGTLEPGAPELRSEARFNRDATSIAGSFDIGLDWISVVMESPHDSCGNPAVADFVDDYTSHMRGVPGVASVNSYSTEIRKINEGQNEGYPKMHVVPIDGGNDASISTEVGRIRGHANADCSMTAVHLYLTDHKATTLKTVLAETKSFDAENHVAGIHIRLAAGNAGVLAAINDELEQSELPMLLYVYLAIVLLVFVVYRDFRAMLACCLPLTIGTFIGYWFMEYFQIGLTVATLPVMVLAVGIGVDYAFYIYNRLTLHLAQGDGIHVAMERALEFEGMATIFTGLTLAIGVATWSFSPLKFQADMGKLLSFMFVTNLVMALTALPALVVLLEKLFPRRSPVRAPGLFAH
ncbi:efflux RND transporter permease subunit [Undibacterium rugosum]|uniref:MMPL family transporter n=1 Tax=Undibacterium rugosum TaxID=2762291 RepID=A0A923I3M6_9BURK|nr:MMPL family transporter [Undibacterium rugosum]MBC3935907.1 MMPL family transporter [Undibacterium rugosum]MBR7779310.1 MMPL family transporter [Undibacterium rugosum]